MALVAAKCTECGAAIEVDQSKEAGICPFCKTAFITEKVINNYVTNNITNIGKMNIGTLNVQQRDVVSDIYFHEVDKVLYKFEDQKRGGYTFTTVGENSTTVLFREYPNRAMLHYIFAFVMLYRRKDWKYVKSEYTSEDVQIFGTWKNCEYVLKIRVEKNDPNEWTENPKKDSKYVHCNHVSRQLDHNIAGRFLKKELEEADRLVTEEEKERYGAFIKHVKDEYKALMRCVPLFEKAIGIYESGEKGKKEARKASGSSVDLGVAGKILKWVGIGIGVAILVFAIVAAAITTFGDDDEEDGQPTETAKMEYVIE